MKKFINYIAPCIEVVGYRQKKKGIKVLETYVPTLELTKFVIGPKKI